MQVQPQPDDPHADHDPAGTPHDGVLRPYVTATHLDVHQRATADDLGAGPHRRRQ